MSQRVMGQSNLTETVSSNLMSTNKVESDYREDILMKTFGLHTHTCAHTYKDYTQHMEEKRKAEEMAWSCRRSKFDSQHPC